MSISDALGSFSNVVRSGTLFYCLRVIVSMEDWQALLSPARSDSRATDLVRFRNGTVMRVRPGKGELGVIREIWIDRLYTPRGFRIKRNYTIVDLGAHIGCFSIYAARKARKGRVIAVEPDPANYSSLVENKEMNSASNISACNAAVTSKDGTALLFHHGTDSGAHSLQQSLATDSEAISVPAVTLKRLMVDFDINHIDFLKIDVEGSERDILLGCPPETLERMRRIVLECHDRAYEGPQPLSEMIAGYLRSNGYAVTSRPLHPDAGLSMLYASRD